MKLTQVLLRQNIQRGFQRLWLIQKDRVISRTNTEKIAESMGVKVVDALDLIKPPRIKEKVDLSHLKPRIHFDERHPDWKDRACLTYDDTNLLIEGASQAQVVTNTIKVADQLPDKYEILIEQSPENVDSIVERIIYTATMFNAHQEKLPKIKDPTRPAWNFPRSYGITAVRKVRGLSQKFLHLCDSLAGPEIAQNRMPVTNGLTNLFVEKEQNLIRFSLTSDFMLMSQKLLSQINDVNQHQDIEFPVLYPMNCFASFSKMNIYKQEDVYPVSTSTPFNNVHTLFAYHDPEKVKNLTELPVTEEQLHGRALMKAFVAAAACARQKYGPTVTQLPKPITVQCVHSNAQDFHFSVLQLNTLDIDNMEGVRNFWWSLPTMQLYEKAAYVKGIPTVVGYNPDVFRTIFAFYRNE